MKQKIKLIDSQSQSLLLLPEQGMGYQIVDIELIDGRNFKNKVVIDSTYLMLEEGELIKPNEILSIKLHK